MLTVGFEATLAAAQAPPGITTAREGLFVRNALPLDPWADQIFVDTGNSENRGLVFSVPNLTIRPAPADPLEISRDSNAVVRVQDGVIRWYTRGAREQELLALLVLDRQRFVVWTPSGYFESRGEDSDTAIGVWSELADGRRHFIPAREYSKDFRRPDIIRRALEAGDEKRAIAQANRARALPEVALPLAKLLPPVGVLVGPPDGMLLRGKDVEVTIEIFAPSGFAIMPTGTGHGERGLVASSGSRPKFEETVSWKERVRVNLPAPPPRRKGGTAPEVTIPVYSPSLEGRSLQLRLLWDDGWRVAMPDLYVLTVGVNQYQDPNFPTLRFAAKDARDVAATLNAQQGLRYRHVHGHVLTDQQATLPELRAKLDWLQRTPQERDVVMLFLAGHGVGSGTGSAQRYYFVPSDGAADRLSMTALSDLELFHSLSRFRSSTVVVFIDTCRSGTTPAQRRLMEDMQAGSGIVLYSATKANRPSQERQRWQNGAFTLALLEGLRGGADVKGNGRITASSLDHFISSRVRELTEDEQEPTTVKATTDLLLARSRPPPMYRRGWFWGIVGGVAAVGLATGLSVGLAMNRDDRLMIDLRFMNPGGSSGAQ